MDIYIYCYIRLYPTMVISYTMVDQNNIVWIYNIWYSSWIFMLDMLIYGQDMLYQLDVSYINMPPLVWL